jgi:hypothetical protein
MLNPYDVDADATGGAQGSVFRIAAGGLLAAAAIVALGGVTGTALAAEDTDEPATSVGIAPEDVDEPGRQVLRPHR